MGQLRAIEPIGIVSALARAASGDALVSGKRREVCYAAHTRAQRMSENYTNLTVNYLQAFYHDLFNFSLHPKKRNSGRVS